MLHGIRAHHIYSNIDGVIPGAKHKRHRKIHAEVGDAATAGDGVAVVGIRAARRAGGGAMGVGRAEGEKIQVISGEQRGGVVAQIDLMAAAVVIQLAVVVGDRGGRCRGQGRRHLAITLQHPIRAE